MFRWLFSSFLDLGVGPGKSDFLFSCFTFRAIWMVSLDVFPLIRCDFDEQAGIRRDVALQLESIGRD